jgi:hypothetical protein
VDNSTTATEQDAAPESGHANDRSIRPVIEHALTFYYDGNAEIARTLIDMLLDENRSQ